MSTKSDPARDFTDLCLRLRLKYADRPGAEALAAMFSVSAWSTDFMLILASIHQRIEALKLMIFETDLDEDIKDTAYSCLEGVRKAFAINGLGNTWNHSIQTYLTNENLTPIRMTSGYVRVSYGYEIPDDEEIEIISDDVRALISWLRDHEIVDRDFIRAALIEGLEGFLFRIERVGSFGWPDSFESLKAVITAYMALERGMPEANQSPPYEAIVKRTGEFLRGVFERVKFAKDVSEAGDWLLRGYGALQAVGHAQPAIAGLLTHAAM